MQRPGAVGGSGGGIWPDGSANYNLNPGQVPIQPMHLGRLNQNQPGSGTKLWNIEGTNSDRASLLGTKQWGKESGGAPWGQTSSSEMSSGNLPMSSAAGRLSGSFGTVESTSTGIGLTSHSPVTSGLGFNIAEYVLGGSGPDSASLMNPTTYGSSISSDTHKNGNGSSQCDVNKSSSSESTRTRNSRENSPTEDELKSQRQQMQINPRMSPSHMILPRSGNATAPTSDGSQGMPGGGQISDPPTTQLQPSDNTLTAEGDGGNMLSSMPMSSNTESTIAPEQQISSFPGSDDVEFGENQASSAAIDGVLQQQMNQLSLDYNTQQQSLAVQLAMQQQFMLAAQQQQLAAMPGVFLPNPYIISAPNASGYTDPSVPGQFPMMPQYSAYTWPNVAYPPMITPQMAASAAASQQQGISLNSGNQSGRTSQTDISLSQRNGSPIPQVPADADAEVTPQAAIYPDMFAQAALAGQAGINPAMAMSGSGYQMIPTAYYDQTGAFIVNNGRYGGPVRLYAPGVPGPMFVNGSQQSQGPGAMYTSPTISGGSTPVPGPAQGMGNSFTPVGPHSGLGGFAGVGLAGLGSLGSGVGSQSSTPQRRDSFSDYAKHQPYSGPMSQFYNSFGMSPNSASMSIGAISPSPGPLGGMMGATPSQHSMSPPPLSSPNSFLGGSSRMFSVAPGAEAKFRNGSLMSNIFGSSGSSLFPPTRIRPMPTKDMVVAAGRSRMLDDFRNNRFPNPQLRDLTSHIVEFSRDQHGSRFIQQKLERATPQEKQMVFNEIARAAYQLMTDVFGNYVIQKFFEFGSQEQKLALAKCIRGHVLPLALQMYGCRVIQKALECIPQEEQVEIVHELDGHLIKCVKDQNGNHVVQKCIECVSPTHLQFIIDAFKGQVIPLSMHPYGCRVMQRILEHCSTEQTLPILEELHQHSETLVTDQYGNYVIQHILEHGRPENKSKIVLGLRGQVLKLSQHKFASNVVEKCVSHSARVERALLIEEACQEPDALLIMMKDQFANYVVQKMLDVAETSQKNVLINKIRPHMAQLRKFTYGKHIIAKLEKYLMKSATSPTGPASSAMSPGVGAPAVVMSREMGGNVILPPQ